MSKGFIKCDPWRSCYFHPTHKLFLIIYVDDFKLSGPAGKLAEGWQLLKEPSEGCPKGIEMDDPTDVGRYLGCEHHVYTKSVEWHGELPTVLDPPPPKPKKNPDGDNSGGGEDEAGGGQVAQPPEPYQPRPTKEVRVLEYDMTQFFESCVQLYAELTDTDPSTYPAAGTPYGPELTDLEDGQGGPRG